MLQVIKSLVFFMLLASVFNVNAVSAMKEDSQQVQGWNAFAEDLYQLHQSLLRDKPIRTEEETGGYPGNKNFFKETRYYNSASGQLISRIQRETKNNSNIHLIEVFLYDEQNRVKVDYLAAYLPEFRNAPIQTLINVHRYNDRLHAFRQFDASGARIYEQCQGELFNDTVFITLEEDEIYKRNTDIANDAESDQYLSCFEFLPRTAENYLNPKNFQATNIKQDNTTDDEYSKELQVVNNQIINQQDAIQKGAAYLKRGDIYFKRHEFESAVTDYTMAINLDKNLDEAYFGRGMALGRQGLVQQGIQDLSLYIQRHPGHSRAYTKRGVRYIWIGNIAAAKKDLLQAIQLDAGNAEAHDDLGVVYASESNLDKAMYHFRQSISYDRSYQKAYHNLALALVVSERYAQALLQIDKGLTLQNNNRNSLLLKATILEKLGKTQEANNIRDRAEFLPEGNWSERFSMKESAL